MFLCMILILLLISLLHMKGKNRRKMIWILYFQKNKIDCIFEQYSTFNVQICCNGCYIYDNGANYTIIILRRYGKSCWFKTTGKYFHLSYNWFLTMPRVKLNNDNEMQSKWHLTFSNRKFAHLQTITLSLLRWWSFKRTPSKTE